MTYLPVGLGLEKGGERASQGSRDNAQSLVGLHFPCNAVLSLSFQTKKYADVIIPRGADNEGEWTQTLPLCPVSWLWAAALAAEFGRR